MEEQELKYENRLVAFIDILGFKEIVKQSERNYSKIELLNSALNFLKKWEISEKWNLRLIEIEEDAQKKGVKNFDIRGRTNTTSFSDSIVVSVKVDDNVNEMTSTLIANLSYIGAILLEKGILFRGGLTVGKIIHNDTGTVFGQGLIDAYTIENNHAKFPRIILSDKLIKELVYPLETKRNRYPYHQYIVRFDDGCVGFHQLIYYQVMESWTEMSVTKLKNRLRRVRKVILNGLDSSFEKPDVFTKYKWLKEQYNSLIILGDYNKQDRTGTKGEDIKLKLHELNENVTGWDIHYSHTDELHEMIRKKNNKK